MKLVKHEIAVRNTIGHLAPSHNTLTTPQVTPQAATPPRSAAPKRESKAPAPKEKTVPLQLWLLPADLRAIRIAAAQNDQKPTEYLLACHRAMQERARK